MALLESGQMYLETIYILQQKNTNIRSIDVCAYLGYSKPSVSRAVGILKKDGYISVYDIEFKMAITVQGTTMNCDIKTSTQFINPGEEVKAEPMSGYQSYPEASEH